MTTYSQYLQISILTGSKFKGGTFNAQASMSLDLFLKGKYELLLENSDVSAKILRTPSTDTGKSIGNYVKANLEKLVGNPCDHPEDRDLEVLTMAASCLLLFVQNNWLGPQTEKSPLSFLNTHFKDKEKEILSEVLEDLGIDGEEIYRQSRHLLYFYLARSVFIEGRSFFPHLQTWDWWVMRCVMIHQSLLPERSPTLKATATEIINDVCKREPLLTDNLYRDIHILFHLEAGHACHDYLEYKKATDHFNTAKKIAGLNVSLSGAMGKRTRFQVDDKAQLVLKVTREDDEDNAECMFEVPSGALKVLELDDDTVLDQINFAEEDATSTPELSPFELMLVFGLVECYRLSVAYERLTTEEVLAYLAYLLNHSTNWPMVSAALHLRSKLEKDSRRRVERSMMQLEILSNVTLASTSDVAIGNRAPLFFASHLSPTWIVKRDHATVLLSLGLTGEALDVFENLEMWENVISCYQRLKKLEKAESLIRERLAVKETPALLCFLGDVTCKLEDYQRAWELSGQRSSRAQRCMGYLYFNERNFEKANECFNKSLEINPLQIGLWFTHGCAAMSIENYELAAKAFRRCVVIDYDNFEAWCNLSTCFVRLKDKKKAFSVLQDSLRCNYDNWRVWENSLIIGIDVGEFNDAIRCYHRLIDLKKKWTDTEVLGILTKAVIEKIPDADGIPADRLHGKLTELFGRVTSTVTGEGEIWSNYAKLVMTKFGDQEPDIDKALQYLQKAYRCFSQKIDWEKDSESCQNVAKKAIELAETHMQCSEGKSQQESLRLLSAAKLMLRGALVKIQKQHTDPVTQELSEQASEICTEMDHTLQNLMSKIDTLRS